MGLPNQGCPFVPILFVYFTKYILFADKNLFIRKKIIQKKRFLLRNKTYVKNLQWNLYKVDTL